jgi:hypothetical protein
MRAVPTQGRFMKNDLHPLAYAAQGFPNAELEGGTSMSRTTTTNLAARMGRWSASHWKTATFGWIAFVVVAFGLAGIVGSKSIDMSAPGPGESGRVDRILDAASSSPPARAS